jgi:glycosyltransferase involved in cell wall biosynthesis
MLLDKFPFFHMNTSQPSILLIGALPPPAIGPSIAMERLVGSRALREKFNVDFLDISDHRSPINIGKFDLLNVALALKQACQCIHRLIFHRPRLVYLGISQGTLGYCRDLLFILPALLLQRRLILHLRGSEFRAFYDEMPNWMRWLTRKVLARTSRIIVLGQGLKKIFNDLIDPSRISVIPNGIDCAQFRPPERGEPPSSGQRLLFLSSLRRRKGVFVLLEALQTVFSRHPVANITFAGLWQDQSDKAIADALIERFGLEKNVRFVGEITGPAKVRLFQEHDVFVFTPVEPEGLPWAILEAMSAALPVVTTDQGAIAEVVTHSETGFIVQPVPGQIAQSICELLEDPIAARAMGQRGRERVENHFSEEMYLSKLTALFQAVLAEKAPVLTAALPRSEQNVV